MKDKEDLKLEALFHSAAINDAGFSDGIVRRIRWQIRVRRYSLPVAMLLGGLIAAKPAYDLLVVASSLVTVIPEDLRTLPMQSLPQMSTLIAGVAVAGVAAMCVRLLEQ